MLIANYSDIKICRASSHHKKLPNKRALILGKCLEYHYKMQTSSKMDVCGRVLHQWFKLKIAFWIIVKWFGNALWADLRAYRGK